MKSVLTILVCGVIQIQAAAAGARTTDAIVHTYVERLVAEVTPLFGPVREAEWAPTWTPRFIHPAEGAQREGVVFTTASANGKERLWLLTAYDVKEGRVEYVFVTPGFTANEIKIRVFSDGEKQ